MTDTPPSPSSGGPVGPTDILADENGLPTPLPAFGRGGISPGAGADAPAAGGSGPKVRWNVESKKRQTKVAVLTSGGDSAGMNAAGKCYCDCAPRIFC